MIWLQACPRCRGDLVPESDPYGTFVSCIQCGNILSTPQENALLGLSQVQPSATRTEGPRRVAEGVAGRMAA